MLTIFPDMPTTRRKMHHYVLDDARSLMWTGAKMGSCLEWLWENGHYEFDVETPNLKFHINLASIIK